MARGAPASPAGGAGLGGRHSGITQWLVDNFCICEGFSVPRYLMYEIYVEICGQNAQNQVNPSIFGKHTETSSKVWLSPECPGTTDSHTAEYSKEKVKKTLQYVTMGMHLAFSAQYFPEKPFPQVLRYHYDDICMKKNSLFCA
ncbi:DNA-binding protein RFX8 [Manis javanica]|nr:DNA-binding protein RFX8 [Manis javanica]